MSCSSWWRSLVLPWPLHSLVWPQEGARTLVSGWGSLETSSSLPRNCACPGLMPAWGFEGVCPQREGQKLTWRSPAPSFCSPTDGPQHPLVGVGTLRGQPQGSRKGIWEHPGDTGGPEVWVRSQPSGLRHLPSSKVAQPGVGMGVGAGRAQCPPNSGDQAGRARKDRGRHSLSTH